MILIDSRTGSANLRYLFPPSTTRLTSLPAADFCFDGYGLDGRDCVIGIERKTIPDLITSMRTGRLGGHQLPEGRAYFDHYYLIVEGYFRAHPQTGILERPLKGKGWKELRLGSEGFMCEQITQYLSTLEVLGGVRLRNTGGKVGTMLAVMDLHQWWSKPRHRGLCAFHQVLPLPGVLRPSFVRRVVKEFPLIGWERSQAVEDKFGTVFAAVNAAEREWREVDGVGEKIAGRVWAELRREA